MVDPLLDDVLDWLRIPSISTGGGDPADIARAAEWVCERVNAAGGTAEPDTTHGGNPLAVGELKAATGDAPTVLIYGHYDVQGVGDESAWTSPPFEPTIRDGRLYARGACDDKGNFFPLLYVACAMAAEGALPVNVRVVVEGEEEVGGESVARWVAADERDATGARRAARARRGAGGGGRGSPRRGRAPRGGGGGGRGGGAGAGGRRRGRRRATPPPPAGLGGIAIKGGRSGWKLGWGP